MEILLEKFAPSAEKAGGRPLTDWRSTLLQPLKVCVGPFLHALCVLHCLFAGGFTQRPSLVTGMTIWSTPNCSGQHNCLPLSLLGWESLNFPVWSPGENSDSRQLQHCGFHLCMYVHTCKHLKYDFGVKFSHEGKECETAYTSGVCVWGVPSCFCWTECFSFFLELHQLGQLKVFLQSGSRPVTVFFRSLSSCLHWIKSWASPWRLHMCLLCSFPSAPSNTISWSLLPHSCPLALC